MQLLKKLEILADAAKYDASCASGGAPQRSSRGRDGLGASTGSGICHSFTPDGRCVSLLKILLTNFCLYDCQYCVNRRTSNVPRARFTPEQVVSLTLDFYRRNYIDGLFLSSGVIRSSNHTMEQLVRVAQSLREDHPGRRPWADRASGPLRGPAERQHRVADRNQPRTAGTRKKRAHDPAGDGHDPARAR